MLGGTAAPPVPPCHRSSVRLPPPEGYSCLQGSENITEASSAPAIATATSLLNKPSSHFPCQQPSPQGQQPLKQVPAGWGASKRPHLAAGAQLRPALLPGRCQEPQLGLGTAGLYWGKLRHGTAQGQRQSRGCYPGVVVAPMSPKRCQCERQPQQFSAPPAVGTGHYPPHSVFPSFASVLTESFTARTGLPFSLGLIGDVFLRFNTAGVEKKKKIK